MRCEANAVMTADGLQGLWRGVLPSLYDRTWGRPLLLLNALDALQRFQRETQRRPIATHRSCCQDFCWICHDPLHRGQDQDGVWCLPIPVGLHSTELDPLCRGPSRTHQRSWSYSGKGCSLLQPLPGLLRPAE